MSAEQEIQSEAQPVEVAVAAAEPAITLPVLKSARGRKPKLAAPAPVPATVVAVKKPRRAKRVAKAPAIQKTRPAKPVAARAAPAAPKVAVRTQAANAIPANPIRAAAKVAKPAKTVSNILSAFSQFEGLKMDMNPNFTEGFKNVMTEAQDKAKAAFEKSSAMVGEYSEFAKGNVEAMVESGKVLTAGLQELGSKLAAEGKTAFEAASADLKELAAVKSPTDFFKLQSEMAKKQFDGMVAYSSKSSEAFLKLAGDVFAPISGRVSLAVEKVKTTSL